MKSFGKTALIWRDNLNPLHFKERERNKNISVVKLELLIYLNFKTFAASGVVEKSAGHVKAVYPSQ